MPQPPQNQALEALIDWWRDMGVEPDEGLMKAYDRAARPAAPPPNPERRKRSAPLDPDAWAEIARETAAGCQSVDDLKAAIEAFEGCPLKQSCQNTVVYDGVPGAPTMVIGEGPGRDEDRIGKPFVGRAGQLLDKMLAAIGVSRETNALITNVNYWRPPNNRNPEPEELLVCRPFVDRMVELSAPKLIIAAGAVPARALLGTSTGIMRLRGSEHAFSTPGGFTAPLFPVLHPAYLLRRPQDKSRAWRDLLLIEQRARELGALD